MLGTPTNCARTLEETRNMKRRELCHLLERFYFSDDGTAGLCESETPCKEQQIEEGGACPLHPRVRKRNERCPLCAATTTRELKRRSLTDSVSSGCSEEEIVASIVHEDSRGEELEYSMDQLLDPKWASCLRDISARLATNSISSYELRRLNESMVEEETSTEGQVKLNMDESQAFDQGRSKPSEPTESLSQLRQITEMAKQSVGKFTPIDDFDFDDNGSDTYSDGGDSFGNVSINSMARSYKKNFAESKGKIFPVTYPTEKVGMMSKKFMRSILAEGDVPSLVQTESSDSSCIEHPTEVRLARVQGSGSDVSRSSSDSSVTLSISSKESFGSSSSLVANGMKNGNLLVSKGQEEHTNSPTSVVEQLSSTGSTLASSLSHVQSEQDVEKPFHFGPPFDSDTVVVSPKVNSSERQQHRPILPAISPIEDVESENDDDEATVAFEDLATPIPSKLVSSTRPTAASRPSRKQCSFISALVQNTRASRSKSRSRAKSRSKSRGRHVSTVESVVEQEATLETMVDQSIGFKHESPEQEPIESGVIQRRHKHTLDDSLEVDTTELLIPPRKEPTTPKPEPEFLRYPSPSPGIRGPILHPNYQLGDVALEEDMIIFPSYKSRKGRDSLGSNRDSNEESDRQLSRVRSTIKSAIGHLCHLDAAFVKRSDGSWTYAIVADWTDDAVRFVVNNKGATKSYPKRLWGSSVRRIRVLTQRHGDRFLFKNGPDNTPWRPRRSIGRGRSRSRAKGRLTSPSPTRRNTGVLSVPPTIIEHYRNGRY